MSLPALSFFCAGSLTACKTPARTLKRQQESRNSQIDRFEASLKMALESQKQWRQRVQQKTLELEQAKVGGRRSFLHAVVMES